MTPGHTPVRIVGAEGLTPKEVMEKLSKEPYQLDESAIPGTVPGPEYPPEVQAMAKAEREMVKKAVKPKTYEPEDGGGETD